jgi:tetratricopeptide (TPR) repeat protein
MQALDRDIDEIGHALSIWCENKDAELLPRFSGMADWPKTAWPQFARRWRKILTPRLLDELTTTAHGLTSRDLLTGMRLARIATRLVDFVSVSEEAAPGYMKSAGEAWRVYAHTLFKAGDYASAKVACGEAGSFFNLEPESCSYSAALLRLTEGLVLYELDQADEALRLVDRTATLLLSWFGEKQKYVEARTIYAAILMQCDRVQEALDVYDETATLAEEAGDTATLAHILNNVGGCHARLFQFEAARACLDTAMEAFTRLGLVDEVPRTRTAKARILLQEERYAEAFSELYICRAEFLSVGAPLLAATVSLWIVEYRLRLRQAEDVAWLCKDMIVLFQSSGLPREALKALAYLHQLAARQKATRERVIYVREFVTCLEQSPDTLFRPPEFEM